MSSLKDLIREWREGLAQNEALSPEELDELEQHLLDSVERLKATGVSDEKAFHVASSRLGGDAALGAEFRKVNVTRVWQLRISWMLVGYASLVLLDLLITTLSLGGRALATYVGADGAQSWRVVFGIDAGSWLLVLIGMVRLAKRGEGRCIQFIQRMPPVGVLLSVVSCALVCPRIQAFFHGVVYRALPEGDWTPASTAIGSWFLIRQVGIPMVCILLTVHLLRGIRPGESAGLFWRHRVAWMFAGYAGLGVLEMLIGGARSSAVQGAVFAGVSASVAGPVFLLLTIGAWLRVFHLMIHMASRGGGRIAKHVQGMPHIGLTLFVGGCAFAGTLLPVIGTIFFQPSLSVEQSVGVWAAARYGEVVLQSAIPVTCVALFLYLRRGHRPAAIGE